MTVSQHFRGVPDMVYAGVQNSETLCALCKVRSHLSQGSFASESGCFPPETVWYLVLSLHLVSLPISILAVLQAAELQHGQSSCQHDSALEKWQKLIVISGQNRTSAHSRPMHGKWHIFTVISFTLSGWDKNLFPSIQGHFSKAKLFWVQWCKQHSWCPW